MLCQDTLAVSERYLNKAKSLLETIDNEEIKPLFNKIIKKLQTRMK